MPYEDWPLAYNDMNLHTRHDRAKAESRRLARQVRAQPGQGLSWQLRWMMCGLGLRLVTLGAWIEGRFLPPASSVGRRVH